MSFLQFVLQEGDSYLAWNRCKDIWDTLVANPEACDYDREVINWASLISSCLNIADVSFNDVRCAANGSVKVYVTLNVTRTCNCFSRSYLNWIQHS